MCEKTEFTSKNIILNLADKLDYFADEYREKKTTGALVDFVHYRADCIDMICKMMFSGVYSSDEVWNMQVYISIVTDELEIFTDNSKSVPQPEFVAKIKRWRAKLNR